MSAAGIPTEWYFIIPPQEVSWSKDSVVNEIATYGTNSPYLNYGTTKMRRLTLGNALIEGFSDGKQIEDNVVKLEACMRMVIEEGTGYASPFCWQAFAGEKSYGTFIITNVKVRETMRDLSGKATRAYVDIELQEVPSYQVSSGIDLTSTAVVGGFEPAFEQQKAAEASKQDAAVSKNKSSKAGSTPGSSGSSGSSTETAEAPKTKATDPSTRIKQ